MNIYKRNNTKTTLKTHIHTTTATTTKKSQESEEWMWKIKDPAPKYSCCENLYVKSSHLWSAAYFMWCFVYFIFFFCFCYLFITNLI